MKSILVMRNSYFKAPYAGSYLMFMRVQKRSVWPEQRTGHEGMESETDDEGGANKKYF